LLIKLNPVRSIYILLLGVLDMD